MRRRGMERAQIMMKYVRTLYDWTLRFAGHRHARIALFGVSFADSIVFPIPPDTLLLPMCLADRKNAIRLAILCSIGSLLGGVTAYVLYYWFAETHLPEILAYFGEGMTEKLETVRVNMQDNAFLAVLLAGLSQIPYKIVTFTAGLMKIPFLEFFLASCITRSYRFLIIGCAVWKYGDPVRGFIEAYMGKILLAFAAFVILALLVIRYALHS